MNKDILLKDIKNLVYEINPDISFNNKINFAENGIDSLDYAFIVVNLEKIHNVDILNLEIEWNKISTPLELANIFLSITTDG
mgnify:CR=1 FL=1